jgi:hypothetical protein
VKFVWEIRGTSWLNGKCSQQSPKISHSEGSIAYWAARAALERNEGTQRELVAFNQRRRTLRCYLKP